MPFGIRDWKPWFVVQSFLLIDIAPIVALLVNSMLLALISFADDLESPNDVIFLWLSETYFSIPISVGVNQLISPFQYFWFVVSGVPPLIIYAYDDKIFSSQLSLNSGNLNFGTLLFLFED